MEDMDFVYCTFLLYLSESSLTSRTDHCFIMMFLCVCMLVTYIGRDLEQCLAQNNHSISL